MAETKRLYGLKSVVTGAGSSIGEAIARTLVKHGADAVVADVPDSGVDRIFTRLRGTHPLLLDQESPGMAQKLAQAARQELEGLDILINNFAELVDALPADAGEAERSRMLERSHQLIADVSQAVLPLLKKSPAGRIINIGCLRSSYGANGATEYAASRHALADLTASQASALGGFGITVNYVQPGAIMTSSSRRVFDDDKTFRGQCIAESAAGRIGEPLDVAKVALFLATDDSVFVSGTGIIVDGGVISVKGA